MPLKHKYAITALLFGIALYFFYLKYVPLVPSFQLLLLPFCLGLTLLTAKDMRRGILGFLFLLPLVNNWPYFFGIQQNIPQAPTASVLFLFFVLGWLIQKIFPSRKIGEDSPPLISLKAPLMMAAALVGISAGVLLWKWMNFFPIVSRGIYELAVNVNGVTTGGAIMSTVFHALSYLSGFGFFMILSKELNWKKDLQKSLGALGAGLLLSILFGFFQHFFNPALGNTDFWVRMGQMNATFKDPNAFGIFLSMIGPLALGAFFYVRRGLKMLLAAVFGMGLFIYPFIGTRSGLLGFGLALAWFAWHAPRSLSKKRIYSSLGLLIVLLIGSLGVAWLTHAPLLERLKLRGLSAKEGLVNLSPERYFLWKEAAAMIGDYPLTGVGVGAYIVELPNYYTEDKKVYKSGFEAWRRSDSAENYFLQVSAEMGLPGLFAFLWVFWTIGSIIKRGLQNRAQLGSARLLFLGAAAGLIAFFVNGLFHSYIGSFETQLGFWFLAALLVSQTPRGTGSENMAAATRTARQGSGKKRLRVALVGLLFIFSSLHLWNSTHSLSLAERTKKFHLNREFGLYEHEKNEEGKEFRWTREYGGIPITVAGPVMKISMMAAHPDIEHNPVRVEFYFIKGFFKEEIRLGGISLTRHEWKTFEFSTMGILDQEGILLVKVSRTWNPLKTIGAPDPRDLGVALGVLSFRNGVRQ